MITPEMKDKVLEKLCTTLQPEFHMQIQVNELLKDTNIESNDFESILKYFKRIQFIKDFNPRGEIIFLTLTMEANDFWINGGFLAQEELIINNIKKLLFEVENLQKQLTPNYLDQIEKLSSLATNIISGLNFLSLK